MASSDIDFQNLPCSGAIISDILQDNENSQIDAWINPSNADIATISIGGNDIGFTKILRGCVLRIAQKFDYDCNSEVAAAYDIINGRDLFNDIASALNQILDRSEWDPFKIYMTGYPAFFNVDTKSCDYTTFYYWEPGHHSIHRPFNWAYLYQPLRLKLNDLVTALNTMLSQVADSVNRGHGHQRVVFVDPNPAFNGHRFCEVDNGVEVIEPDSSRTDTWLFLSGWEDNNLPSNTADIDTDTGSSIFANSEQLWALEAGNGTSLGNRLGNAPSLPDPNTCNATLAAAGNNDWFDQMLCASAIAVSQGSGDGNFSGPNLATEVFNHDQAALAAGNFSAIDVPWFVPTRQAKTFHPRSLGHLAYTKAIMDVWLDGT